MIGSRQQPKYTLEVTQTIHAVHCKYRTRVLSSGLLEVAL